jgi:hypothetical protein
MHQGYVRHDRILKPYITADRFTKIRDSVPTFVLPGKSIEWRRDFRSSVVVYLRQSKLNSWFISSAFNAAERKGPVISFDMLVNEGGNIPSVDVKYLSVMGMKYLACLLW